MATLTLTTPHTTGDEITQAQKLLQNNVFQQDFLQDTVDGEFGPATARGCKRARYWLGFPEGKWKREVFDADLKQLLGGHKQLPPLYKARRALRQRKQNGLAGKAYDIAHSQLGIRESGPNECKFTAWYGMPHQPWCCMFVTYCYVNAGAKASFRRGERWSYCFDVSDAARRGNFHLALTRDPVRGDVVVYGPPGFPKGHIGLFEGWVDRGAGTFTAIEGNTSDMVAQRKQSTRDVRAFVHVGA